MVGALQVVIEVTDTDGRAPYFLIYDTETKLNLRCSEFITLTWYMNLITKTLIEIVLILE